jgi:NIPSNAP
MIVEERIYTIKLGKMGAYLNLYETVGMPIQTRILPRMIGYFTTEIGPLSTAVHLWGYDSLAEREQKRAELMLDPDWLKYIPRISELIERQENRILIPTSFSPIR